MKTRRGYEERILLGLSSDESNRSERKILMMSREREREREITGMGQRPTSDGIPFEFSSSCFRPIQAIPSTEMFNAFLHFLTSPPL